MYPNEYCHQCDPELPPIEVPPPPVCEGEPCEEIYTGNCVKYTGPAIPCLNITTNEDLNSIIAKIAARLCSCCNGGEPVDCVVSPWGPWSECVEGVQTRTRTVLVSPQNGGASCPDLIETRECSPLCTEILNLDVKSNACESLTVSFIDDGSAEYFVVSVLDNQSNVVDSTQITGTGVINSYTHTFSSVPAGTYTVQVEKFCPDVEDPLVQESEEVTLIQCIPPCEVNDFTVNVIDCDTINVTLDETAILPVYDVEYKASTANTWTVAAAFVDASSNNVIAINGLTAATQYTVRVRHYCSEISVSLWSEAIVVTPSCEVVSCPPANYTVNSPACDRINVVLDGSSASTPTYDVEYRVAPNGNWITAGTAVDATVNSIVSITGLLASQAYEVRVRRVCDTDFYSNWLVLGVTTPSCPPVCADPQLRLAQSGCDGIEVTIDNIGLTPGLFEVQYKESAASTWSSSILINTASMSNIYTILGLTEDTPYDIRLRRICGSNLFSQWVEDNISTAVCPAPGDCYKVVVSQQEDVDMSLWSVKLTDANNQTLLALLSSFVYDAQLGTWTKNLCSHAAPVLMDASPSEASVQSITSTIIGDCSVCSTPEPEPCIFPSYTLAEDSLECPGIMATINNPNPGDDFEVEVQEFGANTWSSVGVFSGLGATLDVAIPVVGANIYNVRIRRNCDGLTPSVNFSDWVEETITVTSCTSSVCYQVNVANADMPYQYGIKYTPSGTNTPTIFQLPSTGYELTVNMNYVKTVCSETVPQIVFAATGIPVPQNQLNAQTTVIATTNNCTENTECTPTGIWASSVVYAVDVQGICTPGAVVQAWTTVPNAEIEAGTVIYSQPTPLVPYSNPNVGVILIIDALTGVNNIYSFDGTTGMITGLLGTYNSLCQ